MVSRVADVAQQTSMRSIVSRIQSDMLETQVQISSGKKSEFYSGLTTEEGLRSISLRQDTVRFESYVTNIEAVKPRTDMMDAALGNISQIARDVFTEMRSLPQYGTPSMGTINTVAQNALDQVVGLLNTSFGGDSRYLFAGTEITSQPMDNAAAITTNAQAEVTNYLGGTPPATVLANLDALTGATLGQNAALATTGNVTAKISDNTTIDYTVLANDTGFEQIIRGLAFLANAQFDPNQEAEFYDIFEGTLSRLDSGAQRVDVLQGQLGVQRSDMDRIVFEHETSLNIFEESISNAEDVDIAETLLRLENLQAQLEISFRTLAQLNDLSLANFL